MKRTLFLSAILGLLAPIALVGCGEETKIEDKKVEKTPGGTTTTTNTEKVEKTGDHKDKP